MRFPDKIGSYKRKFPFLAGHSRDTKLALQNKRHTGTEQDKQRKLAF